MLSSHGVCVQDKLTNGVPWRGEINREKERKGSEQVKYGNLVEWKQWSSCACPNLISQAMSELTVLVVTCRSLNALSTHLHKHTFII